MAEAETLANPAGPFPISRVNDRYLLFDVDVIGYARREHNICGVLIGTLPHFSQQNVFLGIPLELMAEEARVLVERGHAYVVDDVQSHKSGMMEMGREQRLKYLELLDKQSAELASNAKKEAESRTEMALEKKGLQRKKQNKASNEGTDITDQMAEEGIAKESNENHLFDSTRPPASATPRAPGRTEVFFITPTSSPLPLPGPHPLHLRQLPDVPKMYPLFKHLHSQGYYSTPGLRFGCHYSVYPGDPLRYHSHFLATGFEWNEEFDMLDIVGGGRLGTGVKKAYLIGGPRPKSHEDHGDGRTVGIFSIEWAGF